MFCNSNLVCSASGFVPPFWAKRHTQYAPLCSAWQRRKPGRTFTRAEKSQLEKREIKSLAFSCPRGSRGCPSLQPKEEKCLRSFLHLKPGWPQVATHSLCTVSAVLAFGLARAHTYHLSELWSRELGRQRRCLEGLSCHEAH